MMGKIGKWGGRGERRRWEKIVKVGRATEGEYARMGSGGEGGEERG